jgi:hypothetical protein
MEEEDNDEGEKTNALATGDGDIAIPPRLGAAMAASRSDVRLIVGFNNGWRKS